MAHAQSAAAIRSSTAHARHHRIEAAPHQQKMEIEPLKDRVWLESLHEEVRGASLNIKPKIIVPYQAAEPSRLAKVLAIGPKVAQNGDLKPGMIVLCQRYGGAESRDAEHARYFFMQEKEIVAIVEVKDAQ